MVARSLREQDNWGGAGSDSQPLMGRVSVTARFNVFRARRKATVIAVSGKYQVFDLAKKPGPEAALMPRDAELIPNANATNSSHAKGSQGSGCTGTVA